jgi:hypothetical protein
MNRNFETELVEAYWITEKIQENDVYAQNLYAALCNNDLYPIDDLFDIIRGTAWSCSWRYAAGLVAEYRVNEDYIHWYCSGCSGKNSLQMHDESGYVPEAYVTDEIQDDVNRLGWKIVPCHGD